MKNNKIYENPDYVKIIGKDGKKEYLTTGTEDSISFQLDVDGHVRVAYEKMLSHSGQHDEYVNKELPYLTGSAVGEFTGRLWLEHKVISFWETPRSKDRLYKYILELEDDLKDKGHLNKDESLFNSGWMFENLDYNEDEKFKDVEDNLIPIEDFEYQEFDAEAYKLHMMTPLQKMKYYKKHPEKRPKTDKKINKKLIGVKSLSSEHDMTKAQWDHHHKRENLQYIKSYKLFESPDTIKLNKNGEIEKLRYFNDDAITFGYDIDGTMLVSAKGSQMTHVDISPKDRKGLKFPGRLWYEHKIISFWEYPSTYSELKKIIKDIVDTYNKESIIQYDDSNKTDGIIKLIKKEPKEKISINVNEWEIEIIVNVSNKTSVPEDKFFNKKILKKQGLKNLIIPLYIYQGSDDRSNVEMAKKHLEVGKGGTKKDFGSRKYDGKLPKGMSLAQYRNKKSKYKYTESFNKFNKMKKYNKINLISEEKHYILNSESRIKDYIEDIDSPYSPTSIYKWMKKYNFDEMATAQLVSDKKIHIKDVFGLRITSKDLKNKFFFDDKSKNRDGTIIPESKIEIGGYTFYLFIRRKGSNDENRARQLHGFRYEEKITKINNLINGKKLYTDKWDGFGSIKEDMFIDRINSGKTITFFDGENEKEITWEDLSDKYKKDYKWNIKNIRKGNSIDMGDYKRISGLDKDFNHSYEKGYFILNVCFYDDDVTEEYFIFINFDVWETYLQQDVKRVKEMYLEMFSGKYKIKLNEERPIDDSEWYNFLDEYKDLRKNGIIRLRPKRNKAQLRMQCSIPNTKFKEVILKENKHIKII